MKIAKRIEQLPTYPFVEISRLIAEKRAQGKAVITFGIGDPDIPTPESVLTRLREAAGDLPNHRYPETEGLPDFRSTVADWYKKRFDVNLDPGKEVLSLIGAKEGIGHIALGLVDPGDLVLQPDPAYPVYNVGTIFAGGIPYWMMLREENDWLPDLAAIPDQVADRAVAMWLNYPNNPTGAVAPMDYLERAVAFAKAHDIVLLHDACYTEVAYDGYRPASLLQVPGANAVGVEFHSLSKSYNMTGWRVGMAVGNADVIRSLFRVKSNLDSGVPQAVQAMAIEALAGSQEYLDVRNVQYQARRDKLVPVLGRLGLRVSPPKAGLYIWGGVPEGYTSAGFATALLDDLDIVVTPGSSYGTAGEGYVRLSLTLSDVDVDEAVRRLNAWVVPDPKN
jgi:LL-diaminopimelate aminotransferase